MNKNAVWVSFVLLVSVTALWFVVKGGHAFYNYVQLDVTTIAKVESFEVVELGTEQFALQVGYTYEYKGREYTGQNPLGSSFPNPWAAQKALEKRGELEEIPIWISSKHPTRSVLEKHFPAKRVLSALVLLGLVIYFVVLGLYTGGKDGRNIS
ncbi:MAG: hypothetical protein K940chlam9_00173 [Chlamydiae bacterium]|nr:hypothetical protein [Chlamydiota bacterium]